MMRCFFNVIFTIVLLTITSIGVANAITYIGTKKDIATIEPVLNTWLAAITTGNATAVTKLYTNDAVLLPTLSPGMLNTVELRKQYFDEFTANPDIKGVITTLAVQCMKKECVANGLYTFTYTDTQKKETVTIPARFTYVFSKVNKSKKAPWMIITHHSSALPVE